MRELAVVGTWSPKASIPAGCCAFEGSVALLGCDCSGAPRKPSSLVALYWQQQAGMRGIPSQPRCEPSPDPVGEGPWVCGVEGTKQPMRDRGEVVVDPPFPRGHRGSPATCGHVWGLQPGPACVYSAAGSGVTRLIPPGWHWQRGTDRQGTTQPQPRWGRG